MHEEIGSKAGSARGTSYINTDRVSRGGRRLSSHIKPCKNLESSGISGHHRKLPRQPTMLCWEPDRHIFGFIVYSWILLNLPGSMNKSLLPWCFKNAFLSASLSFSPLLTNLVFSNLTSSSPFAKTYDTTRKAEHTIHSQS